MMSLPWLSHFSKDTQTPGQPIMNAYPLASLYQQLFKNRKSMFHFWHVCAIYYPYSSNLDNDLSITIVT